MKTKLSFALIMVLGLCMFSIQSALCQSRTARSTKISKTKSISNVGTAPKAVLVKSQSQIRREVNSHFRGMKYGSVNYLRNSRFSYQAVKGAGKVKDKAGRTVSYKYLILSDGKGDIGGVYIGTSNAPTSWNMSMTKGAANQNLARCKKRYHPDSDRYQTCINNFVSKALSDCMLSSYGDEDCADHCWWNTSFCQ